MWEEFGRVRRWNDVLCYALLVSICLDVKANKTRSRKLASRVSGGKGRVQRQAKPKNRRAEKCQEPKRLGKLNTRHSIGGVNERCNTSNMNEQVDTKHNFTSWF